MATREGQAHTRAAREAWKALCRRRRTERRATERAAARAERDARREAVTKAGLRQSLGRPCTKHRPRHARWSFYESDVPREAFRAILHGDVTAKTMSLAAFFGVSDTTIRAWRVQHPEIDRAIERALSAKSALRLIGRIGIGGRTRLDSDKVDPNARSWRGYTRRGAAVSVEPMRDIDAARFGRVRDAVHARKTLPLEEAALEAQLGYAADVEGGRWMRDRRDELRRQLEDFGGVPVEAVRAIIGDGYRSNRAIARELCIAESTLRHWRQRYPKFDRAIRDAIAGYRKQPRRSAPKPCVPLMTPAPKPRAPRPKPPAPPVPDDDDDFYDPWWVEED